MKRSADLGLIPEISKKFTPEHSREIFRRICLIRYFELQAAKAYSDGLICSPVYLSIGQEAIAAAISSVCEGYYLFGQHRCHDIYLAFGGNIEMLIDELLGRPTGCTGGKGGSPMIHDPAIKMVGHHGLIGENIPLAVGFALGSAKRSLCFFGDAAAEEDYAFGAMGFASTHKLPVLFVCVDNDLSILTPTAVRRNWELDDVARALRMPAIDITDDPWLVAHHAQELVKDLPAVINCRTCRHYWHAGAGVDGAPEWDRFELVKNELRRTGIEYTAIEDDTRKYIEGLWAKQLAKR